LGFHYISVVAVTGLIRIVNSFGVPERPASGAAKRVVNQLIAPDNHDPYD
jgi:hypothetical protein